MPCINFIVSRSRFGFNNVRVPKRHHPFSSKQARNFAVGQKKRWPHSSFRLSPDSSGCRGLPSVSSPRRAPRTQFLQRPPRSCLRRIAIGLWPEPTASPCRDVSIQITWRATPGAGEAEGEKVERKGESECSFPRGLTTQERQERLMLSSVVVDPFFLHCNANLPRFLSSPFASLFALVRLWCRTFVISRKEGRDEFPARLSFYLSTRDDLLKLQNRFCRKMCFKIRCIVENVWICHFELS